MSLTIAIIGTGPTGIYAFRRLVEYQDPLSITLFEKGDSIGIGMPYSPKMATKTMLANIASIEIPPVTSTYLDWMEALDPEKLRRYGLDPDDLDSRQFTPRLLMGEYFHNQLMDLVDRARAGGHTVTIRAATEVTDIALDGEKLRLTAKPGGAGWVFDRVMLATGHVFPDEEAATTHYFPSPWSGLIDADVPACKVGIMGTSLSAMDAAMALATQHGTFCRAASDGLSFSPETETLKITLMSRTGVLPEADFYCPIPYEPLIHMNDAALAKVSQSDTVLDAVFGLFVAEITAADPDYARAIGLSSLTVDNFADAYFADREAHDPFRWARANLEEVERNKAEKITVPWRYAILRMHEKVEDLVAEFSATDHERFEKGLRKVFVDNYAAVPSESIRRLLALRDAGLLDILALGETYDLDRSETNTVVKSHGATHVFDLFIDARGQKSLTTKDLPFPSLRKLLLDAGCDVPEVDENYSLAEPAALVGKIFFGAIPYLMHDRPFAQGITAAADIGDAMARGIGHDAGRVTHRRRRWA